jgi:hypothetical protein
MSVRLSHVAPNRLLLLQFFQCVQSLVSDKLNDGLEALLQPGLFILRKIHVVIFPWI